MQIDVNRLEDFRFPALLLLTSLDGEETATQFRALVVLFSTSLSSPFLAQTWLCFLKRCSGSDLQLLSHLPKLDQVVSGVANIQGSSCAMLGPPVSLMYPILVGWELSDFRAGVDMTRL